MGEKKKFPKWLAIVLLAILGYIGITLILHLIYFVIGIHFAGSEIIRSLMRNPVVFLGHILGRVLIGVGVYYGFKKLIFIIQRK